MYNKDKYPLFEDIKSNKVRTWNRCAIWKEAFVDGGMAFGTQYLLSLPKGGRDEVVGMFKDIENKGFSNVRKEVLEDIV